MSNRRKFLHSSLLGSIGLFLTRKAGAAPAAGSPTPGSGGNVISEPVTGHPGVPGGDDDGGTRNGLAYDVPAGSQGRRAGGRRGSCVTGQNKANRPRKRR